MINKIIWKVILMLGGIVGSIFSISKIPELNDELANAKENLDHAIRYDVSYSIRLSYERKITNIEEELAGWGLLLVASIIIFIIGCCISAKLKQENNKQLPPLS